MNDIHADSENLKSQLNSALKKIHKLEEENISLNQFNEIYKEEIKQKSEALQKATNEYSTLRTQYEELLLRVTELHIENQTITSNQSPATSQKISQSDQNNIKLQVEEIKKSRDEYKNKYQSLLSKNETQKQAQEIWNSTFYTFQQMVSPYLSHLPQFKRSKMENSISYSYTYLLEATHELIKMIPKERNIKRSKHSNNEINLERQNIDPSFIYNQNMSVPNNLEADPYKMKYNMIKSKYQKLLNKCRDFGKELAENQALLEEAITAQSKQIERNKIKEEVFKMQQFLIKFEKHPDNVQLNDSLYK